MTETLPEPPELDPAALAGTNFARSRRGFEPAEVHAALGRAADALRAWRLRDQQLLARVERLEEQLSDARRVDEARLTEVLGEETARIIAAARDAAAEIRAHAEEEAERLRRETAEEAQRAAEALRGEAQALRDEAAKVRDEAAADATRLRSEAEAAAATIESEARARHDELLARAESVLAERTAEAEEAAAGITAEAEARLDAAQRDAERMRTEAEQEASEVREAAREEGRAMVAEARAVRERILRDLVERRATARRQVEGARAARDRIVELLRATIHEVASTVDGLDGVEEAATEAAAAAAASVHSDAQAEVAELLVELGAEPTEEPVRPEPEAVPVADAGEPAEPAAPAEPAEQVEPAAADEGAADEGADEGGASVEEVAAEEEPVEATPEEPAAAEEAVVDEPTADDDVDEDGDGAGATVHDLFERIRAEGLGAGPDEGDEADAEDGSDAPAAEGPDREQVEVAVASGAGTVDLVGGPPPEDAGPSDEPAPVTVLPGAPGPAGDEGAGLGASAERGAVATLESTGQLLDRRDELLGPVERSLSRVLRRLASDEQNEILDRLRRVKRGRPDPATVLPEEGTSAERFVEELAPEFARAADAGSTFWAELAGTAAGALFGDDDALRDRLRGAVTEFLDLHRAHLERTFAEAENEGLDAAELADRVRAAYRDWRSGSLADLAGDLATAGFAHGERRAAGPGTPWRWVVDNGGLPCADGEDNALAGPVPCDEPFPTGHLTPPAHPGCRCILVPARQ